MPQSKRTIKLKQADALGREFIKVGSNNKDSYPTFMDLISSVTLPTFVFNIPKLDAGEANLPEIFAQGEAFLMQEVTYASFMQFMFENTIFEGATTQGAFAGSLLPSENVFDFLFPTQEPHFIGTLDESGNIVPQE